MGTINQARTRIIYPPRFIVSGTGGGSGSGLAAWGPEFGGGSPYFPYMTVSGLPLSVGATFTDTTVIGSPFIAGPIQMNYTGTTVQGAPTIPAMAVSFTGTTCRDSPFLGSPMMTFTGTTLTGSPFVPHMNATFTGTRVAGSPFIPALAVSYSGTRMTGSITQVQWNVGSHLSVKDSWTETVALCPADTNHDGTDLEVASTVALTTDSYIAWDLSQFSGAIGTSIAGSIFLRCNLDPTPLNFNINIFGISNGSENWNETTIKCSTRPAASGTVLASFSVPTNGSGTDIIIPFDDVTAQALKNRIRDRMGSGICTVLLQGITAARATRFLDVGVSGGAKDSLGTRLQLTYRSV